MEGITTKMGPDQTIPLKKIWLNQGLISMDHGLWLKSLLEIELARLPERFHDCVSHLHFDTNDKYKIGKEDALTKDFNFKNI